MEELLNRILSWANAEQRVSAVIQTGSFGQKSQLVDKLSDLDLVIIGSGSLDLSTDESWLSKIEEVWVDLNLKTDLGFPTKLVIFSQGQKVDFTFLPDTEIHALFTQKNNPISQPGFVTLLNKSEIDFDQKIISSTKTLLPPTQEEYLSVVKEFWFEVWHVGKYLYREDLWHAKFRDWTTKELLLRMLEWSQKSINGWDYDTKYLGVKMNKWVESSILKKLDNVFGHFDAQDSWQALFATIRLFHDLSFQVATKLGYTYPQDLEKNVNDFVLSLYNESQSLD